MDPRDFVALSIYYHEETPFMDLATYYASLSAASGNSVGLFLYGIALRHGLGVEKDTAKGLEILSRSADAAMGSYAGGTLPGLNAGSLAGAKSFASKELAMVLFEIGNSYRNGWGVSKSESTAMYYYLVASGLGEVDAHVALGDIHMRGEMGCRKDKKAAAKFYRLAVEGGYKEPSLHWIYKEKWL
ncbi:hypothetical protein BC830DRAFT_1058585 [Chytriomyces sp. MP71]|nr:hypothetical protein BC830DRAFT_1058585 [Chytriomyces sp. MP71]